MPLDSGLDHLLLTHLCPQCGHGLEKPGSWFKTASGFTCVQCGTHSRITYPEKLKLFAANADRA